MPTLEIRDKSPEQYESQSENYGATMGSSGRRWLVDNLGCQFQFDMEDGTGAGGSVDDTTLSGSAGMLEAALEEMQQLRQRTARLTLPDARKVDGSLSSSKALPSPSLEDLDLQRGANDNTHTGTLESHSHTTTITSTTNTRQQQHPPSSIPMPSPRTDNGSFSQTLTEEELAAHLSGRPQPSASPSPSSSQYIDKINQSISSQQHSSLLITDHPDGRSRRSSWHPPLQRLLQPATITQREARKMGPNEKLYTEQYQALVADRILAFGARHSAKDPPLVLRDYRAMNEDEKRVEQHRVVQLLQRLGISSGRDNKENCLLDANSQTMDDASCDGVVHQSNRPTGARKGADDDSFCSTLVVDSDANTNANERSMVLLSSPDTTFADKPLQQSTDTKKHTGGITTSALFSPCSSLPNDQAMSMAATMPPQAHNNNDSRDSGCDSANTSMADPKRESIYESPETARREKKRYASTSGKRGSDLVRLRLCDDSSDAMQLQNNDKNNCTTPSKDLVHSIGRLSIADSEVLFLSSQSPIVPRMSHSPLRTSLSPVEYPDPNISFGEDDYSNQSSRPAFDNDSLIETAMLPDKRVRWDFDGKLTKEAPTNVQLLGGKSLLWPKLTTEIRRREAPSTQTFPDPLSLYPEKVQRRLGRLYRWLLQRCPSTKLNPSRGAGNGNCAVVLSLEEQMVVDLVLKLQLDYEGEIRGTQERKSGLDGNTLIVARSKEDLETWRRSFREGSALSVLNHAAMPLSERKSPFTAEKSAQFDIVLTTFDALKSPDITVTLDNNGFANNNPIGVNDGWYKSASQSTEPPDQKKQLSALHRVKWSHLILVDALGRKSYLVKAGTARVQATRALSSQTTLAFFIGTDDNENTGIDSLLKSDRNATQALVSILRVDIDGGDETALRSISVDFHDKSTFLRIVR